MACSNVVVLLAVAGLAGCATEAVDSSEPGPGGAGKADDATQTGFLASLPGWGRYIALDTLDEILPVYLAETRAVLARIDALPAGAVDETTPLADVPIPDLFVPGNQALYAVLDDADFGGGRSDHDVAWLRQSATELAAMRVSVEQLVADGTSPKAFDEHLTNESYWQAPGGSTEITLGVRAVSRFYCNLDIRIVDDPTDGFLVEAIESCD